ncbi:hypothetical protein [Rhodohalobacter sp. 8-1]|uniref:hypothetical protein n=1 Tax=Rhodohalobacter sp. 8-1 TaxID=3131972 RepID=UPI0030ED01D1
MILPFKKTSVYAGFGSISGLVKFENRTLEIEYQTIDEILKYFKSEARQITFQLSDIESVDIKKGWFSYKLFIDLRSLKAINQFPAVKGNRITLKISRANREKLKTFKSSLTLAVSEHKLQQFDDDMDENESFKINYSSDLDNKQRSEKTDQKNQDGLRNALER